MCAAKKGAMRFIQFFTVLIFNAYEKLFFQIQPDGEEGGLRIRQSSSNLRHNTIRHQCSLNEEQNDPNQDMKRHTTTFRALVYGLEYEYFVSFIPLNFVTTIHKTLYGIFKAGVLIVAWVRWRTYLQCLAEAHNRVFIKHMTTMDPFHCFPYLQLAIKNKKKK